MSPRQCIQGYRRNCSDNGIAVPGTSRCRAHTDKSGWGRYAIKHPERAAMYRNPHWKAMRDAQLQKFPDCQVRLSGCRGKAAEADHITPFALGGALDGPLRSVCRPCHLKLTAEASKESKRRAAKRRKEGPWLVG
jgi:5-methylcytosine-specific restriction protein A